MEEKIKKLQEMINESNNIVFFGGAGVSTASGIPDFRSKDGLYNQKYKFPPEEILSHTFFMNEPSDFYTFYKEKMNTLNALPNNTHLKLTELENTGKLKAVITQNIDGLHTKAGTKNVLELHGSTLRNYCMKCHQFYEASFVFRSEGIPKCNCGGIIKPDVVLYEEPLNTDVLTEAIEKVANAEVLIVAGTSLSVSPACSLIQYFNGKYLILLNKEKTPYDNQADLVIHEPLEEIFKKIEVEGK